MIPVQSAIKYINGGDSSTRFGKGGPKHTAAPQKDTRPRATRANAGHANLKARELLPAPQSLPEPERVLQAFEEGRRAFNELSQIHADARAEIDSAGKRLARVEQDLRKEREQTARYASQIASQERELRKLKDGKRAVEELNTRLEGRVRAAAAESESARTEANALRQKARSHAESDSARTEANALRQKVRSYAELMDHADQVLSVCAQLCAPHSAETGQEVLEAQRTMRQFQAAMRV